MLTIRDPRDRDIVLRSLREGIDTSNATGRMAAGVLASLAELELELGRERRAAAKAARKARGMPIGRPRKLTPDKLAGRGSQDPRRSAADPTSAETTLYASICPT